MDNENVVHTISSAVKQIMKLTGKWMELENIQSKVNQAKKGRYYMFSHRGILTSRCGVRMVREQEPRKGPWAQGKGLEGGGGKTAKHM